MFTFPEFTNSRQIQRNYRKLFDQVKKTKKPLIVMRKNKPDVAIVDIGKLEELEAINTVLASFKEAKKGKAKELKSFVDLISEAKKD